MVNMSFRIHQTLVVPGASSSSESPNDNYSELQAQIASLQDQLAKAKAKLSVTPFSIKVSAPNFQNEVVLVSSPMPSPRASPRK